MKKLLFLFFLTLTPFCLLSNPPKEVKKSQVLRKKTPSGLEYEVIKSGSGTYPKKGQQVKVHYTGWLENKGQKGRKFDSSVDRNEPFYFKLGIGQVIKGWDEGVSLMKKGDKFRLIIPSNLAYGSKDVGGIIPANSKLIFDVELLHIL